MGEWVGVLVAGSRDVEEARILGEGLGRFPFREAAPEVASELEAGEGGDEEVWEEAGEGEAVEVSVGDEDEGFGWVEVGGEGGDVEESGEFFEFGFERVLPFRSSFLGVIGFLL